MQLTASLENYLETVYRLEKRNRVARVKDISRTMGVTMASVVCALKKLSEKGLVNYQKQAYITLTDDGLAMAAGLSNRYRVVQDFLVHVLRLSPDSARRQASRLGACIDGETERRLSLLTENTGP